MFIGIFFFIVDKYIIVIMEYSLILVYIKDNCMVFNFFGRIIKLVFLRCKKFNKYFWI